MGVATKESGGPNRYASIYCVWSRSVVCGRSMANDPWRVNPPIYDQAEKGDCGERRDGRDSMDKDDVWSGFRQEFRESPLAKPSTRMLRANDESEADQIHEDVGYGGREQGSAVIVESAQGEAAHESGESPR